MKFSRSIALYFVSSLLFCSNVLMVSKSEEYHEDVDAFWGKLHYKSGNLVADFGGKCTEETYSSTNFTLLNSDIGADCTFLMRTTMDYWLTIMSNEVSDQKEMARITFFNILRFRFRWGNETDVKSAPSFVKIGSSRLSIPGTTNNKHLLWMREVWLKIGLGNVYEHGNYLKLGLIPYMVGRGISLGAAYEAFGFLGTTPGFSIDQYAPGVVLHFEPVKNRYSGDVYFALTENLQTSLSENLAPVRKNELNACDERGISRQSYIAALRGELTFYQKGKNKVTFEPYIVHQHAPDQDLEYPNDVDSFISTAGACVEGIANNLSWGIEGGCNFGEYDIKPWDRNYTTIATDPTTGYLVEQYTKVFTQDPAVVKKPTMAPVTKDIATFLSGSPQTINENGQYIGTVDSMPLYNAYNRFRPQEQRLLSGFFFVGDAEYDCIPKVLKCALGVGYASGYIDQQQNANTATTHTLCNQQFNGFIPLQSVYTGKRIHHLVLFNQGIPRFVVKDQNLDTRLLNITPEFVPSTINEFTNIAFIGTRFDWNVQCLKTYSVNIGQNVVFYWAPEVPQVVIPAHDTTSAAYRMADNFIGTEITTEFSATFYKKLKFDGFVGVLLPGSYYRDLAGSVIQKYNKPTGSSIAYTGNIRMSYAF